MMIIYLYLKDDDYLFVQGAMMMMMIIYLSMMIIELSMEL